MADSSEDSDVVYQPKASPSDQAKIVNDIGYNASPYHKETRDLLTSLGLSPAKVDITNRKIDDELGEIVKEENLEALTVKKAVLMIEERLDITLTTANRTYVKSSLAKLVQAALAPPKTKPEKKKTSEVKAAEKEATSAVKEKPSKDGVTTVKGETAKGKSGEGKSELPGIPLSFPKSLGTGNTHFLIEVDSDKKIHLEGDAGAVGRVSIVAANGKRYANSPEKSKSKRDKTNVSRFKKGSVIRLDMKGDVFQGILKDTKVSMCAVTISPEEAKVTAVFNEFVQASFQKNVLEGMQGEMLQGQTNLSNFTFEGDSNVNDRNLAEEKKQTETKRKSKKRKVG